MPGRAVLAVLVLVLIGASAAPAPSERIDNVPMYGQPALQRPEVLRKTDDDFIAKAVAASGGNRKVASDVGSREADAYLAQRDLDLAMRRYNQAWLLDLDNFRAGTSADPTYADGWRRWAMALYAEGDHVEAWVKVRQAQALNARPFPPAFLKALEQKSPAPR